MLNMDAPLNGEELNKQLSKKIVHTPLADGFLYKGASVMISSQPSVGKSVLAIQAAYQLSEGIPLFACLDVPEPIRVWYIQMERPYIESLERLQYMLNGHKKEFRNLFIDAELQALNFLKEDHLELILNRGKIINPDLVIIDPLYGITTGLSKDEVAASVTKVFTIMKKELDCALWLNHHTVKNTYDMVNGKKVPKDDPFYGAQWLKAHVTGS